MNKTPLAKSKVTMLGSLPPIKGISRYVDGLVTELSSLVSVVFVNFKDIYPDFLYPGGSKDENATQPPYPGVKVLNCISWYNPISWIIAGFRVEGEILHAQWWSYVLAPMYLVVIQIAKLRGKKILLTVHNVKPHESGGVKEFLNRLIIKRGEEFIVHSPSNMTALSEAYDIELSRISVVHHGIISPSSLRGISASHAREKLGIPEGVKTLLFFGIIREYKGLDVLLNALEILVKKDPGIRLLIAGKPWENWRKYQDLIDQKNLGRYIVSELGFIDEKDIEVWFEAADLVVLPYTHFDAQTGAGTLALSFKKPLMVSNVGALPDLVRHEDAVVKPNDPASLADKIGANLNDERLRELGEDSKSAARLLSWKSAAEKTATVYDKIIHA